MRLFLDSSALAKRYVLEAGSDHVITECREATEIILSILAIPEIFSGLNRLKREGKIAKKNYSVIKTNFAKDVEEATIVQMTSMVIEKTILCLETNPVRTLDAIQIASAVESVCDLFLTADVRQSEAARRMKLPCRLV